MCIFKHMSRNTYNMSEAQTSQPTSIIITHPLKALPRPLLPCSHMYQTMRLLYATARLPFCCCTHTHTQPETTNAHTRTHMCVPIVSYRTPSKLSETGGWGGEGKTCQGKAAVLRAAVFICASNLRIIAALITFTPLYDKRKKREKNNNNNGQIEMLHSGRNWKLPRALNE